MGGEAVLADFGIAKRVTSQLALTQRDMAIGTPYYTSAGQAMAKPVDARADLYALGIVIFEMLAGHPPYRATTAQEVMAQHVNAPIPKLPNTAAAFQSVVERLLAKHAEDRFSDAREARAAVLDVQV